jgi:ribA/ribD-fused uncharacterized protein
VAATKPETIYFGQNRFADRAVQAAMGGTGPDVEHRNCVSVPYALRQTVQVGKPGDSEDGAASGIWTVEQLREAEREGLQLEFLFFWGHTPRRDSGVGPHVLSQWYEHEFEVDGVAYRSAEHFMMAEKARLFSDDETLAAILAADSPRAAKALGRRVAGFSQDRWAERCVEIVTRGSVAKFGSSPELEDYLLASAGRVLVEASPTDLVWGIGLAVDDEAVVSPSQWRGQNLLGLALMQARHELIAQRTQRRSGQSD